MKSVREWRGIKATPFGMFGNPWHQWLSQFCLGDDLTDEDGFRALLGKGINIYVGEERQTYAEYILPSQSDVTAFLTQLLAEVGT
jgi:trehalose-6-phosphatase